MDWNGWAAWKVSPLHEPDAYHSAAFAPPNVQRAHTRRMSPSPRIRPDYLLLYLAPTARQCLEAYAAEDGVEFCAPYPNILAKAETLMPKLSQLIASLPPSLVACAVCAALDGIETETEDLPLPEGLSGE